MSLSKKHFVTIASILNDVRPEMDGQLYEDLVDGFVTYFKSQNESFDFARFEKACGIDEIGVLV